MLRRGLGALAAGLWTPWYVYSGPLTAYLLIGFTRAASRKQRRRELCSAPSGLTLRVNLSRFETGSGPDACRQTGLLIVVVVVC